MSSRRVPSGVLILRGIQVSMAAAVALVSVWGLLGGCREQGTAPVDRNRAPETFLTSAPGDSQTAFYEVQLHWTGTDHDGKVVAFDVAVTDSLPKPEDIRWKRTTRSDSLVTLQVEQTREVLGHRFYVRAIDNEGKVDPTPAWIFFGARNSVPPEVNFLRSVAIGPNGETRTLTSSNPDFPTDTIPTGWGVSFIWTGSDGDSAYDPTGRIVQVGAIARYFYRLLPIESEFLGGTLTDTSAAYGGAYFMRFPRGSNYAFNVRAVDDGGLSGTGSVTRSFVWNRDPISRIQRFLPDGASDSVASFVSGGQTYVTGDTLPLPTGTQAFPSVEFTASAYDPDPIDGNHQVELMEWRSIVGAIINPWKELLTDESVRLENLATGDYIGMVRSMDSLERLESTPDSVLIYVNFAPRFVTSKPGFQQTPLPGQTFTTEQLRLSGLECRFLVENPDAYITEQIRYGIRFEGPEIGREVRPHHRLTRGEGTFYFAIARADTSWSPGPYVLYVLAEDNRQTGGEARGTRSKERAVPFRVIAP